MFIVLFIFMQATGGALKDLIQVVQEEHRKASKKNSPCSGIIYVHKRDDTTHLSSEITKKVRLLELTC